MDGIVGRVDQLPHCAQRVRDGRRIADQVSGRTDPIGAAGQLAEATDAGSVHGDSRHQVVEAAKRDLIFVPLRSGRTLHHDVHGRHGAGKVLLRSAKAGTGIIAGGPMRAVFESLGVADVVTKSIGTSNPYNMIRATFDALKNQAHPKDIAAQRGMKYATLQARRQSAGVAAEE